MRRTPRTSSPPASGRTRSIDAIHVAALFSMIVRLADSFDWHVQTGAELAAGAKARLGSSYALLRPSELP